jgi:hypothetical protein
VMRRLLGATAIAAAVALFAAGMNWTAHATIGWESWRVSIARWTVMGSLPAQSLRFTLRAVNTGTAASGALCSVTVAVPLHGWTYETGYGVINYAVPVRGSAKVVVDVPVPHDLAALVRYHWQACS